MEARRELLLKVISRDRPHLWSRNGGVEAMAMPQRDDPPTLRLPPSRCALRRTRRRTGTIEAIKRRAAEKKAAEEKKKAEARARAASRGCDRMR